MLNFAKMTGTEILEKLLTLAGGAAGLALINLISKKIQGNKELKLLKESNSGNLDLKKIELNQIAFQKMEARFNEMKESYNKIIEAEKECQRKYAAIISKKESNEQQINLISRILINMNIQNQDALILIKELGLIADKNETKK